MILQSIDRRLTPGPKMSALADAVFRILTSLIFIIGGLGHFGEHRMMLDRIADSPWHDLVVAIGDPSLLLWLSGIVFVVFGIALALGWMTRLSALLILVTLIPITISVHIAPGHVGPLFKNIAIMGALLLLIARGGGAYSLDNRWGQ
ncbi:DoxX family protein [Parerythrobacter aestuarii]|uniref:DoxX family protein n=1 Tax=Parerythrobacter aestuarii TaxID=3020909 RepID=UPI0024DE5C1F|nr:DoxX family protein [Parerythrobacter aestuarii]